MPNLTEVYAELERNCGLKEGDKVLVTRTAANYENGWSNVWALDMDRAVGNTYVVGSISQYGSGIQLRGVGLWFPFFVLKLVE